MVKIEFEDNIMHIPTAWEDIKLCDYETWYMNVPQTQAEHVQFIADICKIDSDFLLNASVELFDTILGNIRFVFEKEFKPVNKIEIEGINYSISYSDKLTLGEYVDVDEIIKSDGTTKVSDILAVVCRPVGETYDPDKLEERKLLFRNATCDKVLPLITFFLCRKQESEMILHHCSKVVEEANLLLKDIENLARNGDGIKSLLIWQRIKYYFLMRSLKKKLSKFSDSSFINKTGRKPKKNKVIS